jgi:hypothetical protein
MYRVHCKPAPAQDITNGKDQRRPSGRRLCPPGAFMSDLHLVLCLACIVTMLRDHFGSLRCAIFKIIVQLVLLHRAFNVAIGLMLTLFITLLAMLLNGPPVPVATLSSVDKKLKRTQDKEEPNLPV